MTSFFASLALLSPSLVGARQSRDDQKEADEECSNYILTNLENISLASTSHSDDDDEEEDDNRSNQSKQISQSSYSYWASSPNLDIDYTLGDHAEYLHLRFPAAHGGDGQPHCDISHFMVESRFLNLITEYPVRLSYKQLRGMFVGLEDIPTDSGGASLKERLPVRTLTIWLRPDVASDDIVDAIAGACEAKQDATIAIIRKERSHLQLKISPFEGMVTQAAFLIDAQICTSRTGSFDRRLILRVFHAEGGEQHVEDATETSNVIFENSNSEELLVPVHMHMKEVAFFVQHLHQMRRAGDAALSLLDLPCPRPTPRETNIFLQENFQPNDKLLSMLNDRDSMLLQSAWTTILKIWKSLNAALCSYNTIDELPLIDQDEKDVVPNFDSHYCTQIRSVSHDNLLYEIQLSLDELNDNLRFGEDGNLAFLKYLKFAQERYEIDFPGFDYIPDFKLELPPLKLPAGYTFLALKALKTAKNDPKEPTFLVEDATLKVYNAFFKEDEKRAQVYLKDANSSVMERLVDTQTIQMALLAEIENDVATADPARAFGRNARRALNHKGRVERRLIGRVPLLDFPFQDGSTCTVTSTCMLCITNRLFGSKVDLFDLKAVSFHKISSHSLLVRALRDNEILCKLRNIDIDVEELLLFLRTLQDLQSFFAGKGNEEVDRILSARTKMSRLSQL